MAFSEIELKLVEKLVGALCRQRAPVNSKGGIHLNYEIDGHSVMLFEERPQYDNPDKLIKSGIAKFRYFRSKRRWRLYWMRQDLKWHLYDEDNNNSTSLEPLLKIVLDDKWGAFFG